jgi:hypothetical protein
VGVRDVVRDSPMISAMSLSLPLCNKSQAR